MGLFPPEKLLLNLWCIIHLWHLRIVSKYSENNFPVTKFFFQEIHQDIWLVYFFWSHCDFPIMSSWSPNILNSSDFVFDKDPLYDAVHTQFLSTICLSFTCFTGCVDGRGGLVREQIVEKEMEEKKEGQKILTGVLCFPWSMVLSTYPQAGHAWDRRFHNEVTTPVGSSLFVHTSRVWKALQPTASGPAFFSISKVFEGSTAGHRTRPPKFGQICLWTQCLLTFQFFNYGCGKVWAFLNVLNCLAEFSFTGRMSLSCEYTCLIGAFDMFLALLLIRLIHIWRE